MRGREEDDEADLDAVAVGGVVLGDVRGPEDDAVGRPLALSASLPSTVQLVLARLETAGGAAPPEDLAVDEEVVEAGVLPRALPHL